MNLNLIDKLILKEFILHFHINRREKLTDALRTFVS